MCPNLNIIVGSNIYNYKVMLPLGLPTTLWGRVVLLMGVLPMHEVHQLFSACASMGRHLEIARRVCVIVQAHRWPMFGSPPPRWLSQSHHVQLDTRRANPWRVTIRAEAAISSLPSLHTFVAEYCVGALLARRSPNLLHLQLPACAGVTDQAMVSLTQSCTRLQSLDISNCWELSDATFGAIATMCRDLLSLTMCACRQPAVTDAALVSIGAGCTNLRHLSIGGCTQITDIAITGIIKGCRHLQSLDVSGCTTLTDAAFASVETHGLGLQRVNMALCNQETITNATLYAIAKGCSALRDLNMSFCWQETITDEALVAIAAGCPQLQHLDISSCWQRTITDVALVAIARQCVNLRHLDIRFCRQLAITAHTQIVANSPDMHAIDARHPPFARPHTHKAP